MVEIVGQPVIVSIFSEADKTIATSFMLQKEHASLYKAHHVAMLFYLSGKYLAHLNNS